MDTLDRVAAPGRDLLGRVDAVLLAAGAPADHAIWPLLRRLAALPGDVFEGFCAMRPAPLLAAASALRRRADGYADERADLDAAVAALEWEGDAALEFEARWRVLAAHLGGTAAADEETIAGRLAATGGYLDEVAAWMSGARRAVAQTVAEALGSLEAVRLRGEAPVAAAAAIGALVLQTAAAQLDAGGAVGDRWAAPLADLPFRPSAAPVTGSSGPTRAAL